MKEIIGNSIEAQIITLLKNGPLSAVDIVCHIQKNRSKTPKQSVYLALRKLKAKEIIAYAKKEISLNQLWLSRMRDFFVQTDAMQGDPERSDLLNIEEGESITYAFNSLNSLDVFWGHAFVIFTRSLVTGDAILLYNPHEWFKVARAHSEIPLMEEVRRLGIMWLCLIPSKQPLDFYIRKFFDGVSAKCHFIEATEAVFPSNYYANRFGDFVLEVWIDMKSAEAIDRIYQDQSLSVADATIKIKAIAAEKNSKHKMRISKDPSKAAKLEKLFKEYFVL